MGPARTALVASTERRFAPLSIASIFDTRHATFEADQLRKLKAAYDSAIGRFGVELTPNTQRKLGQVVVALARQNLSAGEKLDAEAIAGEAASLIAQLRSSRWLG